MTARPGSRRARPRPHPAARARGTRRGAQPARGGPHLHRLREALRGGRRGAVGAGRDRGQGAPARDSPGALAPDLRLCLVAGGSHGTAGAAAVPQHVLRSKRLVAGALRALRVPAPGAARRRVARRPGAAGRRGDAGRQRAALRAVVRTARRDDPRAPEHGRATPRRRDHLAGTGVAHGGPFRPRLAVGLGRQRRGVLPHRPEPQRRGGADSARGTPVRHGARLRPLQRLQEAGAPARRHGDPAVLLVICCGQDYVAESSEGRSGHEFLADVRNKIFRLAFFCHGPASYDKELRSCSEICSSIAARSPTIVLHTSACHLLQARVDLDTIRAWLGHASLDTINIYAEIDLEMQAKTMVLCDAAEPEPDRPWKENKGLIAFLGAP